MKKNNTIGFFIKGFLMGLADVIPGVSGGTIAFITGIYERLINALSGISFNIKKTLKKLDLVFLLPLGLGIGLAILLMANLMKNFIESYPGLSSGFFFGLIAASSYFLFKESGSGKMKDYLIGVLGIVIAAFISLAPNLHFGNSYLGYFISGALAITAMLLPGISGAFVLLLLNQYENVLTAITNFNIPVLVVFGLGAITGIILFAKVLHWLIKHHKKTTMFFLTGLMVGALTVFLKAIFLELSVTHNILFELSGTLVAVAIGVVLILLLRKKK